MPAAVIAAILLLDLVLCGPLASWVADQKGRSPSVWFLAGAVAGPLALLAVGLAPTHWDAEYGRSLARPCPICGTLVSLLASRCPACGSGLPQQPHVEAGAGSERLVPATTPQVSRPQATRTQASLRAGPSGARSLPERGASANSAPEPAPTPARSASGRSVAGAATARAPAAPSPVATAQSTQSAPSVPAAPDATARPAAPTAAETFGSISPLATAVFAGGSSRLSLGDRYLLALAADSLEIMGPVNVSPNRVALTITRRSLGAAGVGDRIAISGAMPGGEPTQLEFRGLAGAGVQQLIDVIEAATPVETDGLEPPFEAAEPLEPGPLPTEPIEARRPSRPGSPRAGSTRASGPPAGRAAARPATQPTPPETPPPAAPTPRRRTAGTAGTTRKPTR